MKGTSLNWLTYLKLGYDFHIRGIAIYIHFAVCFGIFTQNMFQICECSTIILAILRFLTIYLINNQEKNNNIVKYYYNLNHLNSFLFIFVMAKLNFQHHYFRNHDNMLILCSKNIFHYYQCCKWLCSLSLFRFL